MLQPRALLLSAALFFICQCRNVLGSSLKAGPEQVSNADAADWLEKALWGPGGASQSLDLLHTHRLRLKNLKALHLLPDHENTTDDWIVAPTQPPPPAQNVSFHIAAPAPVAVEDSESDSEEEEPSDEEDVQQFDAQDASDNDDDDGDDMLSAGLRNVALKRERTKEEKRAARRKRRHERAAKARQRAAIQAARSLAISKRATRKHISKAQEAKVEHARAEARMRTGRAVGQINGMLKQVVEEMELEKSRCETYVCTAKKESSEAHDLSEEDQERFARMDTMLQSSRAENSDLESQKVELEEQLKKHHARCSADLKDLRTELTTLQNDTDTTTKLMKASPCKGKALLLQCQRRGSAKPYIASKHKGLRQVMAQLSTSTARHSLQHALRHAVAHKREQEREIVLLQRTHHRRLRHHASARQHMSARHTRHAQRKDAGCTAARMDCKIVETSVILMMADVQDKQHTTKVTLDKTVSECDSATTDMEREIAHFERRKATIAQHVAQTMAEKSGLGGEASLRLQEYERLSNGLTEIGQECKSSVKAYEKQACTLRQTRTDVIINNGISRTPDSVRDCEVSPWSPAESCSEACGGGSQRLIRTVIVAEGTQGMPCPALETSRVCNVQSCPVDCKVSEWSAWTQCSAMCGGGTRSRTRRVFHAAQHGGAICPGENGNAEACNMQPCTPDCVLGFWTPWSGCSRACNGGYKNRMRRISAPSRGNALCPSEAERTDFLKCKKSDCPVAKAGQSLKCNAAVDLIVVLDGSASVGSKSFDDAKSFVAQLFKAMNLGAGKGGAALVLAGGPKEWKAFEKCKLAGSSAGALASCNVATPIPLSTEDSTSSVNSLKAPGGPAYTAGALSLAANQVDQGRPDAKTVVLVIGHGKPLSESRTSDEAAKIRDKGARLMWLVVGGAHPEKNPAAGTRRLSAQLASSWASRPYKDNVFQAESYKALLNVATVTDIVSAACPAVTA